MRRQPSPACGWLRHALLAVLILAGSGIWNTGHCTDRTSVHQATAVIAGPAANADVVHAPAAAVLTTVAVSEHWDGTPRASLEVPQTAADDCRIVTSTVPATATSATSTPPPVRQYTCVVGDAAPRPVTRLLTGRPLTEIGVSRT